MLKNFSRFSFLSSFLLCHLINLNNVIIAILFLIPCLSARKGSVDVEKPTGWTEEKEQQKGIDNEERRSKDGPFRRNVPLPPSPPLDERHLDNPHARFPRPHLWDNETYTRALPQSSWLSTQVKKKIQHQRLLTNKFPGCSCPFCRGYSLPRERCDMRKSVSKLDCLSARESIVSILNDPFKY
mmetsp:Transcript_4621/g.9577  ORF Transcript_4621/g.9577 Transcript_4621/m.9577 type:complete len:183 (-) Transcript_4621:90-638(-)